MSPRACLSIAAIALATSIVGCTMDAAPPEIKADPTPPFAPKDDAKPHETQGVRASTFTFEAKEIGFKMAVAYPEDAHLCVILPESAQDPTACIGVDAGAMIEALPKGADRPFGVAYARGGDWSYFVMMSAIPADLEAREDIQQFVAGAEKAVKEASNLEPKLVVDAPEQRFDLLRVKDVPVVRFRIDAPYPSDHPGYETGSTLYYAAYGQKAAMVTFLTSPKDIDKVFPFAEASAQTLELPPRANADRFGKSRAELHPSPSVAKAIAIFGPIVAAGILLFWWLGTRKSETKPEDEAKPASEKSEKSPGKKQRPAIQKDAPADDEGERDDEK
ncbi:MAG: hypothetical protein U0441_20810 [Polyangiaceae bacterium]